MSKLFAANLRAYRAMAGMTQTELAKATGTTRSMINNYEQGRSEPSFEVLCRMAAALGVELDALVKEHEYYPEYIRTMQVTDDESALLQAYREADTVYQGVALEILRTHRR